MTLLTNLGGGTGLTLSDTLVGTGNYTTTAGQRAIARISSSITDFSYDTSLAAGISGPFAQTEYHTDQKTAFIEFAMAPSKVLTSTYFTLGRAGDCQAAPSQDFPTTTTTPHPETLGGATIGAGGGNYFAGDNAKYQRFEMNIFLDVELGGTRAMTAHIARLVETHSYGGANFQTIGVIPTIETKSVIEIYT